MLHNFQKCSVKFDSCYNSVQLFPFPPEKASFINEMVAQKTSEGNDVTFECSFKGTPAVQVTWSLDGRPLPQFSGA